MPSRSASSRASGAGRLDPPLLMALDEVTQICPVPVPSWLANSGGKGIQIITVAHGEAQLRSRWGADGARIIVLSDRDIQALLKDVQLNVLSRALKGASQVLKDKFMRNMSTRAAESLNEDLAAMGPVRISEVEEAQGAIAKVAVDLAEKGKITIVRPTDRML